MANKLIARSADVLGNFYKAICQIVLQQDYVTADETYHKVLLAKTNKATEAAQALAVLGYTSAEVAQALKGVDVETLSLEEIIRQCLKKMVK